MDKPAPREGTERDLERIVEIRVASEDMKLTRAELTQRGFTVEAAAAQLQRDWKFFVFEINGKVMGFCLADRSRNTIEAWFVEKSVADNGFGGPLLREALQWLWDNGAERVTLVTNATTGAYAKYIAKGWRKIGTRPNGYVEMELPRPSSIALPAECGRCHALRRGVLVAAFVVNAIVSGCLFSLPLSFAGIADSFGVAKGDVANVFALTLLLYFTLGAFSSWSCTRFMPRNLALAGTVFAGTGMLLCAAAPWLAHPLDLGDSAGFMLVYVGFSIGIGLGGAFTYFPSIAALRKWYRAQIIWSLAASSAGIAIGMAAVPLVAFLTHGLNWQYLYFVFAALNFSIAAWAAFRLRGLPQWEKCLPDGRRANPKPDEHPPPDWDHPIARIVQWMRRPRQALLDARRYFSQMRRELLPMICWALHTPRFYIVGFAGFFAAVGFQLPVVFLLPFAQARDNAGHDPILLLTWMGLAAVAGRVALGAIADRGQAAGLLAVTAFAVAVCLVWWDAIAAMPPPLDYGHLWLFAAGFGLLYGALVPLYQAVIQEECESPTVMLGVAFFFVGAGSYLGPMILGAGILSGDRTSFWYGAGAVLLAAILVGCLELRSSNEFLREWLGFRAS